ncbi:unnamed protein product [Symbiodinium pilosum]|uniref:Globin domain-containing protein n=1 Tax=Symbiodinium pilosum TaxID=2952 RepID=A0A812Y4X0_SYMPI|nr:unnamed protein product [Symbiodinium pilosum]
MDEAPGLKQFFKSPKSVFGLRFMNGMNSMLADLDSPSALKKTVETYGFQHLDHSVTTSRVELIREAILSVAEMELGGSFTDRSRQSLGVLLNYIGGAFIFVLRELADRIRIIQRSWKQVNKQETIEHAQLPEGGFDVKDPNKAEPEDGQEDKKPKQETNKASRSATKPTNPSDQDRGSFLAAAKSKNPAMQVPTDFAGMFMFNATVMGFSETAWMNLVLDRFDNIATNVANSGRVQEECFVLSLCLARLPDTDFALTDFRAVMLAALRSLIPDEWDMDHEVAWNWLWENVERVVSSTVSLPRPYEKAVRNFMFSLEEDQLQTVRIKTYALFFTRCPAGQEYFKQSTTRLYFILDKINEMIIEILS